MPKVIFNLAQSFWALVDLPAQNTIYSNEKLLKKINKSFKLSPSCSQPGAAAWCWPSQASLCATILPPIPPSGFSSSTFPSLCVHITRGTSQICSLPSVPLQSRGKPPHCPWPCQPNGIGGATMGASKASQAAGPAPSTQPTLVEDSPAL